MSFLKITDPEKRDFIVQEFLKAKNNVRNNYLSERTGEIDTQRDLTKFFKPVIESQQAISKDIAKEITEPISKALLPVTDGLKAITLPNYPAIKAYEDPEEIDTSLLQLGPIASEYLRIFASKEKTDKTFGIYDKDNKFYIGNTPIEIKGDNITVGNKEYQGTPGLWELMIMSNPDKNIYTPEDYTNYSNILVDTNAIYRGNDPNSSKPKASKGNKYTKIIKPIWDIKVKGKLPSESTTSSKVRPKGTGITILPSDPNALIDRLDKLMAEYSAGNTGVRNEIVAICDELLRMGIVNKDEYKSLVIKIAI